MDAGAEDRWAVEINISGGSRRAQVRWVPCWAGCRSGVRGIRARPTTFDYKVRRTDNNNTIHVFKYSQILFL